MAERGRPTKYKPEYCQHIVDYFITKKNENDLPFFSAYGREIDVCEDTMIEWTNVYPDFSEAYKKCKSLQKEIIIKMALNNQYNSTFAIFTAKNMTDMRDQTSVQLQGDKEKPLQLEATMNIIHQRFPIQQIEE
jgi:hypothetical protein